MWRNLLWKNRRGNLLHNPLLKKSYVFTLACGEKNVEALSKKGVIHINLYYGCYYYLNLFIDIFIFHSLTRKETDYAFYL